MERVLLRVSSSVKCHINSDYVLAMCEIIGGSIFMTYHAGFLRQCISER